MKILTLKNVFWFLIGLFIIQKISILFQFSFVYTENDQLIYWNITKDIANGIFKEPFFYGQDYNFPLEAYLAAPFYKIGVPLHIVLPSVTMLMAIFPCLIIVRLLYNQKAYLSAIVALLFMIGMSVFYDMVISIPRGFVQGLFFASFGFFFLNKKSVLALGVLFFIASFSFYINPNSFFLTLLILALYFKQHDKELSIVKILSATLGVGIAYVINLKMNLFYAQNPNYNLHFKEPLKYFFSDLERLNSLDTLWVGLSPFVWHVAIVLLIVFVLLLFGFYKQRQYFYLSLLGFLIIAILFSAGVSKVGDGKVSAFFPYTRFYLSLPLIIIYFIGVYFQQLKNSQWLSNFKGLSIVLLLSIGYTIYKLNYTGAEIDKQMGIDAGVQVVKVGDLKKQCIELQTILKANKTNLLVLADRSDNIAYGCPCLLNTNTFETLNPRYERRTWKLEEENKTIRPNFLLYFYQHNTQNDTLHRVYLGSNFQLFKIESPNKPTLQWLKNNNYEVRKFDE